MPPIRDRVKLMTIGTSPVSVMMLPLIIIGISIVIATAVIILVLSATKLGYRLGQSCHCDSYR